MKLICECGTPMESYDQEDYGSVVVRLYKCQKCDAEYSRHTFYDKLLIIKDEFVLKN